MTDRLSRHLILGAAGHVDHGKTALVTALTGVHTDRLKEEQERGISIELGFAEFDLGEDLVLGVVDMPGHERFVKQMVAGAGGVDLALLVVAADEGVMPQTVEHLEILNSLGVRSGIIAITKTDLVDEDIQAVAAEEARELVEGTFLADKPMVPVSAVTGAGLQELATALRTEAEALPSRGRQGVFRLPVDRVFTLPGAGTIVTGTCWSGAVAPGDRLVVEPHGQKVRVREVQAHGRPTGQGGSGQRLALALHGVKKEDLLKGYQVVTPDSCQITRRLDLRVDLLPHYKGVVKNRQRLHVHHAGREVLGRIVLLDETELGGEVGPRSGLAQLHLEQTLVAQRGDRLVLRFYSPVTTMAGGTILDGAPGRHKRFDSTTLKVLAVKEAGDPAELFLQRLREAGLDGLVRDEQEGYADIQQVVSVGDRLYHGELLAAQATSIQSLVQAYADKFPLRLGVPKEEARRKLRFRGGRNEWNGLCQAMAEKGGWVVVGDKIAATAHGPELSPSLQTTMRQVEKILSGIALRWPGSKAFAAELTEQSRQQFAVEEYLRYLVDRGRAVQVTSDYYIHADALQDILVTLREHFQDHPELKFAEFRDLTGLTRKLGIPMLEFLDQSGVTTRVGDLRRPGPALAVEA